MLGNRREELVREDGLLQEGERADLLAAILEIRTRTNEDDRDGCEQRIALECLHELKTVHEGHLDVSKDEIRTLLGQQMPGDDRVLGEEHLVARIAEMHAEELAH